MSNTFGNIFRLTTFGESHGIALGGVIDGCPAGLVIDTEAIQRELARRRPGYNPLTSTRAEEDIVEILSGIFEGKSLGTPIAFIVRNGDVRSSDYAKLKDVFRPGHADETWLQKFGIRDYRGGGRSSARETLSRVVGGAIAKMFLRTIGIEILAWVSSVSDHHTDMHPDIITAETIESNWVRCPDAIVAETMKNEIENARTKGDSLGGVITCKCEGVMAGIGEPVFDKLPALMAHAMMSLPAARSFESDGGNEHISKHGSVGNLMPQGASGGISTGGTYLMKIGFKPVSSISRSQQMKTSSGEVIEMAIEGRHDPCVLPRAVPIVEAMAALVLADLILRKRVNQL